MPTGKQSFLRIGEPDAPPSTCSHLPSYKSFLSKYARIPPSSAGRMNGLPSPLGGEGKGEGEFILSSPPP